MPLYSGACKLSNVWHLASMCGTWRGCICGTRECGDAEKGSLQVHSDVFHPNPATFFFPCHLLLYAMHFQSLPFSLFLYLCSVAAHGAHEESKEPLTGDAAQYAQRHVRLSTVSSYLEKVDLNTSKCMCRWRRNIICT